MRTSLTFGKFAGIPLKIHLNWFIVAALVTWSLAAGYFPHEYPGWTATTYWMVGLVTAFLFFFSVLLHEIGHSLIALREGVPVRSITLFIFGGVAHISHEPENPASEFRIVVAGPLTSLVLASVFFALAWSRVFGQQFGAAATYLSQINLILAVFNLIPGFPLDGGRILRSILWKFLADFTRATRWATNTGLGIAMLFVLVGLFLIARGNYLGGLWVAFIGWYLSTVTREGYRHNGTEPYQDGGLELVEHSNPLPQPGDQRLIPAYFYSNRMAFVPVTIIVRQNERLPFRRRRKTSLGCKETVL